MEQGPPCESNERCDGKPRPPVLLAALHGAVSWLPADAGTGCARELYSSRGGEEKRDELPVT